MTSPGFPWASEIILSGVATIRKQQTCRLHCFPCNHDSVSRPQPPHPLWWRLNFLYIACKNKNKNIRIKSLTIGSPRRRSADSRSALRGTWLSVCLQTYLPRWQRTRVYWHPRVAGREERPRLQSALTFHYKRAHWEDVWNLLTPDLHFGEKTKKVQ